jgi:aryl-alcohol dehydrogenase-like predicted oxidoreductase
VETSINIVDQVNIDGLLPVAREHNVGVMAKRPIGNASWRPLDAQPGFYKEYAKAYHERFQAMGLRLDDLGPDPGTTDWADVALRFTLSQPGVHTAIIGTTNPDNAARNAQAVAQGPLPDAAIRTIREAFAKARAQSADDWSART